MPIKIPNVKKFFLQFYTPTKALHANKKLNEVWVGANKLPEGSPASLKNIKLKMDWDSWEIPSYILSSQEEMIENWGASQKTKENIKANTLKKKKAQVYFLYLECLANGITFEMEDWYIADLQEGYKLTGFFEGNFVCSYYAEKNVINSTELITFLMELIQLADYTNNVIGFKKVSLTEFFTEFNQKQQIAHLKNMPIEDKFFDKVYGNKNSLVQFFYKICLLTRVIFKVEQYGISANFSGQPEKNISLPCTTEGFITNQDPNIDFLVTQKVRGLVGTVYANIISDLDKMFPGNSLANVLLGIKESSLGVAPGIKEISTDLSVATGWDKTTVWVDKTPDVVEESSTKLNTPSIINTPNSDIKIGSVISGVSAGSLYKVIAVNEFIAMAAKVKVGGLSVRIISLVSEVDFVPQIQNRLLDTGFSKKPTYWSVHYNTHDMPAVLGALLLGLGINFTDQVKNLNDYHTMFSLKA